MQPQTDLKIFQQLQYVTDGRGTTMRENAGLYYGVRLFSNILPFQNFFFRKKCKGVQKHKKNPDFLYSDRPKYFLET